MTAIALVYRQHNFVTRKEFIYNSHTKLITLTFPEQRHARDSKRLCGFNQPV
jgi:hypothetical protein